MNDEDIKEFILKITNEQMDDKCESLLNFEF
jgi:hypothetical protein